ncbi:MAG: hypothetical protein K8R69_05715 [Deltaproteobacteria bacterium]|nr:hypothetical protein [Deltaproteobacteria bacterium]
MQHFLHILSLPDNIPIIIMMVSVVYLTWLSFSEARKNDKLTEEGKADQIYRRMVE